LNNKSERSENVNEVGSEKCWEFDGAEFGKGDKIEGRLEGNGGESDCNAVGSKGVESEASRLSCCFRLSSERCNNLIRNKSPSLTRDCTSKQPRPKVKPPFKCREIEGGLGLWK